MHEIHHICEKKHSFNRAHVCQNIKNTLKEIKSITYRCVKKETAENYQPKKIRRLKENGAIQGKTFCFKSFIHSRQVFSVSEKTE